ncbi:carbohydrate ABC transporter permease [Poseidonocella sp. HB161398]|uniref:carbohydrate ABC transporter permease n=1 Tax=Poseidonocella sp. HB161398 TaxID=2320855 RepID=UPI001F0E58B9|nr:sugar ABC transporter permease [Poseidonocella sp. HB161398]
MTLFKTDGARARWSMPLLALGPSWAIVLFCYLGTVILTFRISLTSSGMIPNGDYVGLAQYRKLLGSSRWETSFGNMLTFGAFFLAGALLVGTALAVALDRGVRGEAVFRTIFLYPQALSFIVTGLVWQWLMNPALGIQAAVQGWGWTGFSFDWPYDRGMAIYAVVLAGVWQASGVVMVLMLAGLRGIDRDIWRAARVDGISTWRTYAFLVLPQLGGMLATSVVLLSVGVIKVYDLVVALTGGGPGTASDVPAKFIMDYLFGRQNIALASAASIALLVTVLAVFVPFHYAAALRRRAREGAR